MQHAALLSSKSLSSDSLDFFVALLKGLADTG